MGWQPPCWGAGVRGHPQRPHRLATRGRTFTFVTDGIESALAQAKAVAGEKVVAVAAPTITRQCLDAGLLDEIVVNLVPVLLGNGIPFFADLAAEPVTLDGPTVIEGTGVTHLSYRVLKPTTTG